MKKIFKLLPVVLLSTSLLLQGCGGINPKQSKQGSKAAVKKISAKKVEEKEPVNSQGRYQENPEDQQNATITATSQGNWIYYIYYISDENKTGLKRFNSENKELNYDSLRNGQYGKTVTTDYIEYGSFINVIGSEIYFSTKIDNDFYICKVKNDGTGFTKITKVPNKVANMVVTKDFIIYEDLKSSIGGGTNTCTLHMLKIDGSNDKTYDNVTYFYLNNEILYYMVSDESSNILNKLDLTTNQTNKVFNFNRTVDDNDCLYVNNDKVYYLDNIDNKVTICSAELNSSNITKLTTDDIAYFALYDNKIYFTNKTNGHKLYQMDLDGKNLKKLDDKYSDGIEILNKKLYYWVKNSDTLGDTSHKVIDLDKNK